MKGMTINMKKLTELKDGQKAKITGIDGDRRYLSRVTSIGLNVGCNIEMLQNVKNRPVLVYGRDTMIALNRNESERITVEVLK
jgi:fe2+ transport system protein A